MGCNYNPFSNIKNISSIRPTWDEYFLGYIPEQENEKKERKRNKPKKTKKAKPKKKTKTLKNRLVNLFIS